MMDYIRGFDIKLEKEMYYAGETLHGQVLLDTTENFKLKGETLVYHTLRKSIKRAFKIDWF